MGMGVYSVGGTKTGEREREREREREVKRCNKNNRRGSIK
jgi:hypothetical protein